MDEPSALAPGVIRRFEQPWEVAKSAANAAERSDDTLAFILHSYLGQVDGLFVGSEFRPR